MCNNERHGTEGNANVTHWPLRDSSPDCRLGARCAVAFRDGGRGVPRRRCGRRLAQLGAGKQLPIWGSRRRLEARLHIDHHLLQRVREWPSVLRSPIGSDIWAGQEHATPRGWHGVEITHVGRCLSIPTVCGFSVGELDGVDRRVQWRPRPKVNSKRVCLLDAL